MALKIIRRADETSSFLVNRFSKKHQEKWAFANGDEKSTSSSS